MKKIVLFSFLLTSTCVLNATVTVTYDDGTSGNLTTFAAGGTIRAGRMIPLNQLIPYNYPPIQIL